LWHEKPLLNGLNVSSIAVSAMAQQPGAFGMPFFNPLDDDDDEAAGMQDGEVAGSGAGGAAGGQRSSLMVNTAGAGGGEGFSAASTPAMAGGGGPSSSAAGAGAAADGFGGGSSNNGSGAAAAGAHPGAGGGGGSSFSAPSSSFAAGSPAPAAPPPLRPILRGRISEALSSSFGAGASAAPGTSYVWEGQWAMAESDTVWSDFKYSFRTSDKQPVQLPPSHVMPANPRLPSAPEHAVVGAPMNGYFFLAGPTGPVKNNEPKITFKIGGPLPADAPTAVKLPDGSMASGSALVGITGDGVYNSLRYTLAGAYHPPTGTAWVRKCYGPVKGAASGGSSTKAKSTSATFGSIPKKAGAAGAAGGFGPAAAAGGAGFTDGPREKRQVRCDAMLQHRR
jgi:hypothetical protein